MHTQPIPTFAAAAALLLLLAGCFSSAPDNYLVEVNGEITRTMEGGEFFLENIPGGKQIYIQRRGRGEKMQVLQVLLPETIQEGEYLIYPNTPVTASYWDRNKEGSWIFDVNPMGKVVFQREGDRLRGTINFIAEEWMGQGSVQVHAEFWDVPYPADWSAAQTTPAVDGESGEPQPDAGPISVSPSSSLLSSMGICALVAFLIVNFGIQFYVGRQVYPDSKVFWLRSLNGTRTLIRGWKDPTLRPVMIAWSLLISIAGSVLCLTVVLTQG